MKKRNLFTAPLIAAFALAASTSVFGGGGRGDVTIVPPADDITIKFGILPSGPDKDKGIKIVPDLVDDNAIKIVPGLVENAFKPGADHGLKVQSWKLLPAEQNGLPMLQGIVSAEESCIVSLESSPSMNGFWKVLDTDFIGAHQDTEFLTPKSDGDQSLFFRFRAKPVPVKVQFGDSGYLVQITGKISVELVSLFLRDDWGVPVEPEDGVDPSTILDPTNGFVTLQALGLKIKSGNFPRIDWTPSNAGVLGRLDWLQKISLRPQLHGLQPNASGIMEPVTSASTFLTGNYKVPMIWKLAHKDAVKAKWVIQRSPFSDPNAYTPPMNKSVVGTVAAKPFLQLGSTPESVSFTIDFKTQAHFGIEAPEAFFLRLYELDKDNNIVGLPSNTFSFVVREDPPELPAGYLRMKLYKIKCYDTTSGGGDDELVWKTIRVSFHKDKVVCKTMSTGWKKLGDGEYTKPGKKLWDHSGPSDFPKMNDIHFIHILLEDDGGFAGSVGDENLSITASGMQQLGKSRSQIMSELRSQLKNAVGGSHDIIGIRSFNLTNLDLATALSNAKADRKSTMTGDSSKYVSTFRLEWFPN